MNRMRDMREYLSTLEQLGEVLPIGTEVDWNLEIGAITRRCSETGSPAPLFTNIKGYEKGFRVLGAPMGISRKPGLFLSKIAIALGMQPEATGAEIVDALAAARENKPVPPRVVADAPCKQNKMIGKEVDLKKLPSPMIHAGDGGRYINTWGAVIFRTPDGSWTNWSIARVMMVDGTRMTGPFAPGQHMTEIRDMWTKLGKPAPFAIAIGCEPAVPLVCASPLPDDVEEGEFLGAYYGEPVDVVKCETNDLLVPVSAEIVIEGHISMTDTAIEGPFGEYTGYIAPKGMPAPIYEVEAITYRDDAILPIVAAGEPIEEDDTAAGPTYAAELLHALRGAQLPVTQCWSTLKSALLWMAVTVPENYGDSFKGSAEDLVRKLGEVFYKTRAGSMIPKLFVTYDDIDLTDTDEFLWAISGRLHPTKSIITFPDQAILPLAQYWTPEEQKAGKGVKVAYNGLFGTPGHLRKRCSFAHGYSPELQKSVIDRWTSFGFDELPKNASKGHP